jgi:GNAT superfamily N-acetyltransferase
MYYLTDVYVLPSYQGRGLGRWLVGRVREMYEHNPNMRWACLVTGSERTMSWYNEMLGMQRMEDDAWMACVFGPGHVE